MREKDNRLDDIFQCIVEAYIETAEPVGSRVVSKKYSGHLSPASVRNVMADLEERGLIQQPHTSAGRVPTEKGYRYYVDALLDWNETDPAPIPDIDSVIGGAQNIDDAAERMSHLLADLTGNAGILFVRNVKRISYIDELRECAAEDRIGEAPADDRLYVGGTSHMIEQPEFRDAGLISALLKALELKGDLAALLQRDLDERRLHVHIGRETGFDRVPGVSIVVREYCASETPIGCVGVMGPTRMQYDKAIGTVSALAKALTEFFSR